MRPQFAVVLLAWIFGPVAPVLGCEGLWKLAKNYPAEMKRLAVGPETITAVVSAERGGTFAHGVFIVNTPAGRRFLKLFAFATPEEMAVSLAIQTRFAEVGLGPSVSGIIDPHHVPEMLNKFPEMAGYFRYGPSFGVLMTELDRPWPVQRLKPAPEECRNWDFNKIERQLDRIDDIFRENRILAASDTQVAITPAGDAYVIDFDLHHLISSNGEVIGFHSPDGKPIDSVRAANSAGWAPGREEGLVVSPTQGDREILRELRHRLRMERR